ncbi:hypothetical protein F5Y16DRAFT_215637 [Xylariaceae sp. FL0255]|nr:hypothetical protein F5Y16DRAFT_215637 [Xylariaceae sp. FL0255]
MPGGKSRSRNSHGHSIQDLTNTFVLAPTVGSRDSVLSEIPHSAAYDPARQRRAHTKSRTGCDNCRKRRVKCSEGTPCENCARRGDRCERGASKRAEASLCSKLRNTPSALSFESSTSASVNLVHMRLFHHFQENTLPTLLVAPEAWGHALQLSFHFDFLMDALLGLSARHLSILKPKDKSYQTAAASHFCRAFAGLRREISKDDVASIHFDAFMAASILFYFYTWSSSEDQLSHEGANHATKESCSDSVFEFSHSLKHTLLKVFQDPTGQLSVFRVHLLLDPSVALVKALEDFSATPAVYEETLSYRRPVSEMMLGSPCPGRSAVTMTLSESRVADDSAEAHISMEDVYNPVLRRLSLLLPFLPDQTSHGFGVGKIALPKPAIARYILSFPLLGWSRFPLMIEQGDTHALLLLYHFYRSVNILLSDKEWWWAHGRASAAERVLHKRLMNAIKSPVGT